MALAQNPEEADALQRFEPLVKDLGLDTGTVMRFLRARDLDFTKAEAMIRSFASWRVNNAFEQAALKGWTPPKEMLLHYEVNHCGLDEEGRPVFYINFCKWLPSRVIYDLYEPFDVILFAYKTYLGLFEEIIQKSKHQQSILLVDGDEIGYTTMFNEIKSWKPFQTLIEISKIYEATSPETLHAWYFLNVSKPFLWGFNILKGILTKGIMSKYTVSKISVFGTDDMTWKSTLSENNIPEKYGGKAKLTTSVYDIVYDGVMSTIDSV